MNQIKLIAVLVLTLFFSFQQTSYSLTSNRLFLKDGEKIKISNENFNNFKNFLKNSSEAPLYFAISEDGSISGSISCFSTSGSNCNTGVRLFQLIKYAERKHGKKIFVISRESSLVVNNKNLLINNKNIDEVLKNYFEPVKVLKSHYIQRYIFPSDRDNNLLVR